MQVVAVLALLAATPQKASRDAGGPVAPAPMPSSPSDLADPIKWLSTGDGGAPFAKYTWMVPDLLYTVDVPAVQVVNGLPVRFSVAVSSARPDFLVKYYIDEFAKAGLYIPPAEHQLELGPPAIQVTALDTDNLISYTAMLQVVDDKHTNVIMSQGYLQPWLKKPRDGDFAPLFPGAEHVVRTHSEGVDFIQFTSTASATAVEGFYGEVLKREGFVEAEEHVFVKGPQSIKVVARKQPGHTETATLLERRASSGP